jgi:hypothetical protein
MTQKSQPFQVLARDGKEKMKMSKKGTSITIQGLYHPEERHKYDLLEKINTKNASFQERSSLGVAIWRSNDL